MKHVDSRMGELFRHLRRAIDVLEQITLPPYLSSASERPPRKLPESSPVPPTSSFEKRAYTIEEVGTLTGVSRTMIYHSIKIKELRAVKCGHKTMIRAQDDSSEELTELWASMKPQLSRIVSYGESIVTQFQQNLAAHEVVTRRELEAVLSHCHGLELRRKPLSREAH